MKKPGVVTWDDNKTSSMEDVSSISIGDVWHDGFGRNPQVVVAVSED